VSIVKYTPFRFNGDGIYLGHGLVITAAHVVGHWPSLTRPQVIVDDQDLPAKIIKEGSRYLDFSGLKAWDDLAPNYGGMGAVADCGFAPIQA
jgi:hypothetical protein